MKKYLPIFLTIIASIILLILIIPVVLIKEFIKIF
jgi:hypothetical protein